MAVATCGGRDDDGPSGPPQLAAATGATLKGTCAALSSKLASLADTTITAISKVAAGTLSVANDGDATDFARFYHAPGMNHCAGGPATDQFDMLTKLVAWVEQGQAPDAVTASARGPGHAGGVNAEVPATWAADRTRPLCPYPKVARYNGSGSLEATRPGAHWRIRSRVAPTPRGGSL
jgi:hypothetical protein